MMSFNQTKLLSQFAHNADINMSIIILSVNRFLESHLGKCLFKINETARQMKLNLDYLCGIS